MGFWEAFRTVEVSLYIFGVEEAGLRVRQREIPHMRKPTATQERGGRKKRRLAPFGMTARGAQCTETDLPWWARCPREGPGDGAGLETGVRA